MKKCPFCAEEIQDEAVVCHYCGRDLSVPPLPFVIIEEPKKSREAKKVVEEPKTQPQIVKKKDFSNVIIFSVIIGLVACIIFAMAQSNWSAVPSTASNSSSPTAKYSGSSSSSGGSTTSWFKGGTLHKSKVKEWRNATYANRLATSADFIAATQNVDYGNLTEFKQMATDLETCISTAVSGGDVDNEDVVFISSMCTVSLFPK